MCGMAGLFGKFNFLKIAILFPQVTSSFYIPTLCISVSIFPCPYQHLLLYFPPPVVVILMDVKWHLLYFHLHFPDD